MAVFLPRLTALLALAVLTAGTSPAAADCTCRAGGRDHALGAVACLPTPQGSRQAVCDMVLNNTAWRFTATPCVSAEATPPAAGAFSGEVDASSPPENATRPQVREHLPIRSRRNTLPRAA